MADQVFDLTPSNAGAEQGSLSGWSGDFAVVPDAHSGSYAFATSGATGNKTLTRLISLPQGLLDLESTHGLSVTVAVYSKSVAYAGVDPNAPAASIAVYAGDHQVPLATGELQAASDYTRIQATGDADELFSFDTLTVDLIGQHEDGGERSFFDDVTVTVTATDSAGNASPTITLYGDNPMSVGYGEAFVEPGYSASDAESGDLTGSVVVTDADGNTPPIVDTQYPGEHVLTYSVTDADGASAYVERVVDVSAPDSTPALTEEDLAVDSAPPIAGGLVIAEPMPIYAFGLHYSDDDGTYHPSLASRSEPVSSIDFTPQNSSDTTRVKGFVICYQEGKIGVAYPRIGAATEEIVGFTGGEPLSLEFGSPYTFPGEGDESLAYSGFFVVVADGALDIAVRTGSEGIDTQNQSYVCPDFAIDSIIGYDSIESADQEKANPNASVNHTVFFDLMAVVTHNSGPFGIAMPGVALGVNGTQYEISYDGMPFITLYGDNPMYLAFEEAYSEPGAMGFDPLQGDVSGDIVIDDSALDTSTPGTYAVTYTYEDAQGNVATAERTVIVGTPNAGGNRIFVFGSFF